MDRCPVIALSRAGEVELEDHGVPHTEHEALYCSSLRNCLMRCLPPGFIIQNPNDCRCLTTNGQFILFSPEG